MADNKRRLGQKKNTIQSRRWILSRALSLGGAAFALLTACGGGSSTSSSGGGIVATGKALINGNVKSSNLPGGIAGLGVRIDDSTTTTDSSGRFSLQDVSKGDRVMIFQSGENQARLSVTVPDTAVLTLDNIAINGATASPGKVTVSTPQTGTNGTSGSSESPDASGTSGSSASSGIGSSGSSGSGGSSGSSGSSGSGGSSGSSGSSGYDDDDD